VSLPPSAIASKPRFCAACGLGRLVYYPPADEDRCERCLWRPARIKGIRVDGRWFWCLLMPPHFAGPLGVALNRIYHSWDAAFGEYEQLLIREARRAPHRAR
jgi:hypothetical protein